MSGIPRPVWRDRRWIAVAVTVVAALLVVLALFTGGGGDPATAAGGSTTPTTTAAPSSSTTAPPAPQASTSGSPTTDVPGVTPPAGSTTAAPAGSGDEAPTSLAPVALTERATGGDGVSAALSSLEAIDASGSGIGSVGGPALRVVVTVTNGSAAALDLGAVQVTTTYSDEQTVASPVNDPSVSLLGGSLSPGATASGTYVFSVPADQRDVVTVTVGHAAGAPLLVFTGAAA
jgi:hypothetical protein